MLSAAKRPMAAIEANVRLVMRESLSKSTGKPLKLQAHMRFGLTAEKRLRYCRRTVNLLSLSPVYRAYASYWWWYGFTTEGAALDR